MYLPAPRAIADLCEISRWKVYRGSYTHSAYGVLRRNSTKRALSTQSGVWYVGTTANLEDAEE